MVFWFGMSQHEAQGRTLALLVPPIRLLAAWTYYKQGYVDLKVAGLSCVGFLIGGLCGAKLATGLSNVVLEKVFGGAILAIATATIRESTATRPTAKTRLVPNNGLRIGGRILA